MRSRCQRNPFDLAIALRWSRRSNRTGSALRPPTGGTARRASGEPVDLVITDVVMPRMSGFEFAERMRAARPDTKLLLVSGQLNHPSLRGREIPEGLTLLVKPFETNDLRSTVRELLDRGRRT